MTRKVAYLKEQLPFCLPLDKIIRSNHYPKYPLPLERLRVLSSQLT